MNRRRLDNSAIMANIITAIAVFVLLRWGAGAPFWAASGFSLVTYLNEVKHS